MKYTRIGPKDIVALNKICIPGFIDEEKAKESISYFMWNYFDLKPYKLQHLYFKYVQKYQRVVTVKSRQVGISLAAAFVALWATHWNKFPSGPYKNTKVGVVSRSDEQAKKLMLEIRKLIHLGDEVMYHKTGVNKYFTNTIKLDRHTSFSKTQMTLSNGSTIKCFPPTDSCRGESFDILIIDEAAFVDDEPYKEAMKPTTSRTNGKIILQSTPNGQKGFFFEHCDPFDKYDDHEFERLWFYWKHCEDKAQLRVITDELKHAKEKGNLLSFDQEYNALFTVDEGAFFADEDIDRGVDEELDLVYEYKKGRCSIGLDYGSKNTQTTITVKTKIGKKAVTLFQWGQRNFDNNLLMEKDFEHSIPNLMERYDVNWIVADDCIGGETINKWMEGKGYPVLKFNFRSDQMSGERNRGYYLYRSALKRYLISYPRLRKMIAEMKALQYIQMKIVTSIHAPRNYTDDLIDSEMMASYPFLMDEDGSFGSELTEEEVKETEDMKTGRVDSEWLSLQEIGNPNRPLPGEDEDYV